MAEKRRSPGREVVATWGRLERTVARRAARRPPGDDGAGLPARLPAGAWALGIVAFFATHVFMFAVVHPHADLRVCGLRLDDPLYALIPHDRSWRVISRDVYVILTLGATGALALQAVLGDHRPLLRWGVALTFQALLRSLTIYLVPLCRATVPPGTRVLTEAPTLDLGFVELPWRMFATNDLLFSGHVGELVLLLAATRSWPRPLRALLWSYQVAQIYALLATRGHYTVDILVAFPCALLADRLACRVLAHLAPARADEARQAVPAATSQEVA